MEGAMALVRSTILSLACMLGACVQQRATASAPPAGDCYTESGWLDSTNGCSIRAGYPDCYLVCPRKGTRLRL
jgi:hypothetical protein